MKTVFEHIREHLLESILAFENRREIPSYRDLLETENHREVWALCDNRMVQGAFRYGKLEEKEKEYKERGSISYDVMTGAQIRIALYEKDGNLEHILDAINLLAMEFRFSSHPNKHFECTDDGVHVSRVGDE